MKRERKNRIEGTVDMAYCGILLPDEKQEELILKTLGCKRFVYNHFLDERIQAYKDGVSITYTDQQNKLPAMKDNPETEWLSEVDSTALQNALRDLQNAFDNFYHGRMNGRKVGFPKFKCKRDLKSSYRTTNNNNSIHMIDKYHIQLPKLGIVKCKMPRKPKGRIMSATITKESSGTIRISIQCETMLSSSAEQTGLSVGVDLGIKELAITSNGELYDNPKSYEKNQKRLKRLQRKLSRKPKDSNNREKDRQKVAKLHKHIKNQRKDATHKMTHELVKRYDVICIEDLKPSIMVKDKYLSKSISDANFGEIRRQLEYKCAWNNKQLVVVDRFFPSSQLCSVCGARNEKVKNLGIRYWICPHCKTKHDRDMNAANNILQEGLKLLALDKQNK